MQIGLGKPIVGVIALTIGTAELFSDPVRSVDVFN